MGIYRALSLTVAPQKTEPDVWVRRLVIYRKITPEPDLIREITLTRGVNIVWAEESEDESSPTEITGHSAGKTSFCRLFRYALGEKTYGTKANMALIQRAFPGGYLGAELTVRGQLWAVIRPIGQGVSSYVKPGATIEQLLTDRTQPATQDDYPVKLGLTAILDDMDAGAVPRTDKPIEWGHLVAWCARDQEARFQNCFDWRSPRSESDWPSFRSSKADPLFVMRTVLGLFLPNELRGEERLANLVQEKEGLEQRLADLKREPQFRVNLYDLELRRRLREACPGMTGIDSMPLRYDDLYDPDLERVTDTAKGKLEAGVRETEDEKSRIEAEIEAIGGRIIVLEGRREQLDVLFSLDAAGQQEAVHGADQRERDREFLDKHGGVNCLIGGVPFRDCSYVQDRQQALEMKRFQDAHSLEHAAAARAQAQQVLDGQKQTLQHEIANLQLERKRLRDQRTALDTAIQGKRDEIHDLISSREQLIEWTRKADAPGQFLEIDDCKRKLKEVETRVASLTSKLDKLLAQHDINKQQLSSIFSKAVHGVLASGHYDGKVDLVERKLNFQITRGAAMSGEAVETLAVLLADLSCMVYNSVSDRSRLPGFLLHDSPREADLSLDLYHQFIQVAAELEGDFSSADKCPFQYIITTTTPPPKALRGDKWVKLHLNAAIPKESLFRQNLAVDGGAMQFSDDSGKEGQP